MELTRKTVQRRRVLRRAMLLRRTVSDRVIFSMEDNVGDWEDSAAAIPTPAVPGGFKIVLAAFVEDLTGLTFRFLLLDSLESLGSFCIDDDDDDGGGVCSMLSRPLKLPPSAVILKSVPATVEFGNMLLAILEGGVSQVCRVSDCRISA